MSTRHHSTSPSKDQSVSREIREISPRSIRLAVHDPSGDVNENPESSSVPDTLGIPHIDSNNPTESFGDIYFADEASNSPQHFNPAGLVLQQDDYTSFDEASGIQLEQHVAQPDAGGFASYFGGDSVQNQDDLFSYDYTGQYSIDPSQQPYSEVHDSGQFDACKNSYTASDRIAYKPYDVGSDYFDSNQQLDGYSGTQNGYQSYFYEPEFPDQAAFNHDITEADHTATTETSGYSFGIESFNQPGYYGAPSDYGYHQENVQTYFSSTDHDVYSNPNDGTLGSLNFPPNLQNAAFADIDLNGSSASQYHPAAASKSPNLHRPPDPHPLITFAFGGRVGFSFIRTATLSGNRALSQDVEIKIQSGKLQICSCGFLLRGTSLVKCISDYPGPLSSQSNVSAICQKQAQTSSLNRLLWRLIDTLATCKGVWDIEKVTSLLTSPGLKNGDTAGLASTTAPLSRLGYTQLFEANDEDLIHIQRLVTIGKHDEATHYAASRDLWSHALIISMNCDESVRSSLIQRYRDKFLEPGSQLYTVYSALAACPVQTTKSWSENLAALLNIKKSSDAISQLGELLLSENNTVAAHTCFLLSGRLDKLSLLALPATPAFKFFQCPYAESVQLTECFEHAVRQKDSGFTLESLVYARFCYSCLLIDLGDNNAAFRYIRNILRLIADSSKNKKVLSERFCYAVKCVDHQLSQIASADFGSESSGVLGSIFNNISKLLIGKDEQDNVKTARQSAINPFSKPPSSATADVANASQLTMPQSDTETSKANIISKLTGLFRSRNPSPQNDLADFEEEERFEWDPVTKKWVSNVSGPAKPLPAPAETSTPVRRPPPRPNASVPSQAPRTSVARKQITTRYALENPLHHD